MNYSSVKAIGVKLDTENTSNWFTALIAAAGVIGLRDLVKGRRALRREINQDMAKQDDVVRKLREDVDEQIKVVSFLRGQMAEAAKNHQKEVDTLKTQYDAIIAKKDEMIALLKDEIATLKGQLIAMGK